MQTHTAQKEIAHECVCVYISAACTCQHKNIRSPAPHLYTHQRHVRTKTTKHRHQHKKIRSSAPHSHTRTNTQKKNVHTNISKMRTPGGLRTIHIRMHMLRTIYTHTHTYTAQKEITHDTAKQNKTPAPVQKKNAHQHRTHTRTNKTALTHKCTLQHHRTLRRVGREWSGDVPFFGRAQPAPTSASDTHPPQFSLHLSVSVDCKVRVRVRARVAVQRQ